MRELSGDSTELVNTVTGRKPLFTAVVAVYNANGYLEAFLRSLSRQTLGARQLEIILVDDCSTDQSRALLLKWARQRRNVRVFANQKRMGVANTRNIGYDHASGTWTTSVDPDDLLDPHYFSEVKRALLVHRNADLLMTRVAIFNQDLGIAHFTHPLDFKFRNGTQIACLAEEPRLIQLGATAFVRTKTLHHARLRFDSRVRPTFEDAHLLIRYLLELEDPTVLVIPQAIYFYRIKNDNTSLVNSAWRKKEKYIDEVRFGYLPLLKKAASGGHDVPRWLENIVLYQLSWQFNEAANPRGQNAWISYHPEILEPFLTLVAQVMTYISSAALEQFSLKEMPFTLRALIEARFFSTAEQPGFAWLNTDQGSENGVHLQLFTKDDPTGYVFNPDGTSVTLSVQAHWLFNQLFGYETEVSAASAALCYRGRELKGRMVPPAQDRGGGFVTPLPKEPHLIRRLAGCYSLWQGLFRLGRLNLTLRHLAFGGLTAPTDPRLLKRIGNKGPVIWRRIRLRVAMSAAAFCLRLPAVNRKYRKAWLIIDRMSGANDNGEHFYRYLARAHKRENAFFMIGRQTPDFKRLKREGFRILPRNVFSVAMAVMQAQVIVASDWAAEDLAFIWNLRKASVNVPLVFLQHGITKDDISFWLNTLDAQMVVTTLPAEQRYLTQNKSPYHFKHGEAVRTGMARYDRLQRLAGHRELRSGVPVRIAAMPTWRNSLRDTLNKEPEESVRHRLFGKSALCRQWSALLSSPTLMQLLDVGQVSVDFISHPNMVSYLPDYALDARIHQHDIRQVDFQRILSKTDLFITDYSSAAFDAVIAGARVAYFQFDQERFFGGEQSMRPGWFDYERDGFGPVFTVPQDLIAWIGSEESSPSKNKNDIYMQRRSEMRAAVPHDCCEATYQEIRRRFGSKPRSHKTC